MSRLEQDFGVTNKDFVNDEPSASDMRSQVTEARLKADFERYIGSKDTSAIKASVESLIAEALAYDPCNYTQRSEDDFLPFITDAQKMYRLCKQNIHFIGGPTKMGKTTLAANIAAGVILKNKPVAYLSNEEPTDRFFSRVACILTGLSFSKLCSAQLSSEEMALLTNEKKRLHEQKLLTVVGGPGKLKQAEEMLGMIEWAKGSHDCLIIDYYQNILTAKCLPNAEHWKVLQYFGQALKDQLATLPATVLFAQLRPDTPFRNAVKGGTEILQHVTDLIEISPDFASNTTRFAIIGAREFPDAIDKSLKFGLHPDTCQLVKADTAFDDLIRLRKASVEITPDNFDAFSGGNVFELKGGRK